MSFHLNNMALLSEKNKKKILTSIIAAIIFAALVTAVVFTLAFIRDSLGKTVGELDGAGNGEIHFELEKAGGLGIVAE